MRLSTVPPLSWERVQSSAEAGIQEWSHQGQLLHLSTTHSRPADRLPGHLISTFWPQDTRGPDGLARFAGGSDESDDEEDSDDFSVPSSEEGSEEEEEEEEQQVVAPKYVKPLDLQEVQRVKTGALDMQVKALCGHPPVLYTACGIATAYLTHPAPRL